MSMHTSCKLFQHTVLMSKASKKTSCSGNWLCAYEVNENRTATESGTAINKLNSKQRRLCSGKKKKRKQGKHEFMSFLGYISLG